MTTQNSGFTGRVPERASTLPARIDECVLTVMRILEKQLNQSTDTRRANSGEFGVFFRPGDTLTTVKIHLEDLEKAGDIPGLVSIPKQSIAATAQQLQTLLAKSPKRSMIFPAPTVRVAEEEGCFIVEFKGPREALYKMLMGCIDELTPVRRVGHGPGA